MSSKAEIWEIPLQVVTPAFVGGADPNERAELRVTSIRGALRSWYRLLVGPEVAAGTIAEFSHLRESLLFGGVARGEGQGLVQLSLSDRVPTGTLDWDNRKQRRTRSGLAYLGFSLDMGENDRKALEPGTTFELRLLVPRGLEDDVAVLLLRTLWLWVTLGGIGSRSRRGFGSLAWNGSPRFTTVRGDTIEGRRLAPPTADGFLPLAQQLVDELGQIDDLARPIRAAVPGDGAAPSQLAYRFEIGQQDHRTRVLLWGGTERRGWKTASDALDAIGEHFAEFRQPATDGLPSGALGMLTRGERLPHAPHRTAFGLPLTLRPVGRRKGPSFDLLPYDSETGEGGGRAPSPLLFRICPMGQRFVVVLTLLSGPRPGRDLAIRERRQRRGFIPPDPNSRLPEQFLDNLPRKVELQP